MTIPKNWQFFQCGCACWVSSGPFGVVLFCARKLNIYRCSLQTTARTYAIDNFTFQTLSLFLIRVTFRSFSKLSSSASFFVFLETLAKRPEAFFVLLDFRPSRLYNCSFFLFAAVCHTTSYFCFRSSHYCLAARRCYVTFSQHGSGWCAISRPDPKFLS